MPCLSSAAIDHFLPRFSTLRAADVSIVPGNRTVRGLATVKSILSYCGQEFTTLQDGAKAPVRGWCSVRVKSIPGLGTRLVSPCNVPDLSLFPARYPTLRSYTFGAGLELAVMHLGLYSLSLVAATGVVRNLDAFADPLLTASKWLLPFGTPHGAMQVELSGDDVRGNPLTVQWSLVGYDNHGPYIPAAASAVLAKKLLRGWRPNTAGATVSCGTVTLEEYLAELRGLHIFTATTTK